MSERPSCVTERPERGFTLIELMVVISLIVILASMGLVGYHNSVVRAREATLHEDLTRLRSALDQYYADKGAWPPDLASLVTDGYIRELPKDPFTGTAESWVPVQADLDPSNPTADPGVMNVKSGTDQTALDGSKYADW